VGVEHKLGIHARRPASCPTRAARSPNWSAAGPGPGPHVHDDERRPPAVGVEGVGIAERAYQQALAYAQERKQGRSVWTGEANAPIFDHPDVRRTLSVMKAKIEAARAICLSTAVAADLWPPRRHRRRAPRVEGPRGPVHPDRQGLVDRRRLSRSPRMGVQIHGGMGFIEETGAAQHYRDARITPIYEGTNGIQAMDLVGRKLSMDGGQAPGDLMDDHARHAGATGRPAARWAASLCASRRRWTRRARPPPG
jgi:hypothetical protein